MRNLNELEFQAIHAGLDSTERMILSGCMGAVLGAIWIENQLVFFGGSLNPAATIVFDGLGLFAGSGMGLVGGLIFGALYNELMA